MKKIRLILWIIFNLIIVIGGIIFYKYLPKLSINSSRFLRFDVVIEPIYFIIGLTIIIIFQIISFNKISFK